jgi:hypothetical protein
MTAPASPAIAQAREVLRIRPATSLPRGARWRPTSSMERASGPAGKERNTGTRACGDLMAQSRHATPGPAPQPHRRPVPRAEHPDMDGQRGNGSGYQNALQIMAATRAAMTAGSTAVCDQQTAEGHRLSPSRGVQRLGRATDMSAVARQKAAGRLCAVRADLPGLCRRHRRCMRPQIPGLAPGWSGASTHVLRFPRGLSSGFPFARRALPLRPPSPVSLRPAFSGSVPSAAARFRFSVGFPPGSLP